MSDLSPAHTTNPEVELSEFSLPKGVVTIDAARGTMSALRYGLESGRIVQISSGGKTVAQISPQQDGRYSVVRGGESTQRVYVPGQAIIVADGAETFVIQLPKPNLALTRERIVVGAAAPSAVLAPSWAKGVQPEHACFNPSGDGWLVERLRGGSIQKEKVDFESHVGLEGLEPYPRPIYPGCGMQLGDNWFVQIEPRHFVVGGHEKPGVVTIEKGKDGECSAPYLPQRLRLALEALPDGGLKICEGTEGFSILRWQSVSGALYKLPREFIVPVPLAEFGFELLLNAPGSALTRVVVRRG